MTDLYKIYNMEYFSNSAQYKDISRESACQLSYDWHSRDLFLFCILDGSQLFQNLLETPGLAMNNQSLFPYNILINQTHEKTHTATQK